jgi:hypothetical protein
MKYDLCLHLPSNKYYLVKYIRPDYYLELWEDNIETNYWLWKVMPDKIGGVYGGSVMKLVAKRFTLKWFLNLHKLWKKI